MPANDTDAVDELMVAGAVGSRAPAAFENMRSRAVADRYVIVAECAALRNIASCTLLRNGAGRGRPTVAERQAFCRVAP